MDSFTYITPTQVPTDKDGGGSGGNAYCVIAHTTTVEAPTNMDGGGSGGNAYCVVAWTAHRDHTTIPTSIIIVGSLRAAIFSTLLTDSFLTVYQIIVLQSHILVSLHEFGFCQ